MKKLFFIILTFLFILVILAILLAKSTILNHVKTYKFKNLPTVCGDIKLGGFSDLFYKNGYFYAITDRGPNSREFVENDTAYRVFNCVNYHPYIVKFKLEKDEAKVVEVKQIPELSGMPIAIGRDSTPLNEQEKPIPFDINGADTESFIIDKNGNYWIGEEYYPSIIKLDSNLKFLARFAPVNSSVKNPKITYNLPEEFNKVRTNLGFESMFYDGDKYIYVFTQSGLKGEETIISVIKFNIDTQKCEKVLKYNFQDKSIMSAVTYTTDGHEIFSAERINGKHYLNKLVVRGNKIEKTSIIKDLQGLENIHENIKIEGLANVGKKVYIINDNDFGIDETNDKGCFVMEFKRSNALKNLLKIK